MKGLLLFALAVVANAAPQSIDYHHQASPSLYLADSPLEADPNLAVPARLVAAPLVSSDNFPADSIAVAASKASAINAAIVKDAYAKALRGVISPLRIAGSDNPSLAGWAQGMPVINADGSLVDIPEVAAAKAAAELYARSPALTRSAVPIITPGDFPEDTPEVAATKAAAVNAAMSAAIAEAATKAAIDKAATDSAIAEGARKSALRNAALSAVKSPLAAPPSWAQDLPLSHLYDYSADAAYLSAPSAASIGAAGSAGLTRAVSPLAAASIPICIGQSCWYQISDAPVDASTLAKAGTANILTGDYTPSYTRLIPSAVPGAYLEISSKGHDGSLVGSLGKSTASYSPAHFQTKGAAAPSSWGVHPVISSQGFLADTPAVASAKAAHLAAKTAAAPSFNL